MKGDISVKGWIFNTTGTWLTPSVGDRSAVLAGLILGWWCKSRVWFRYFPPHQFPVLAWSPCFLPPCWSAFLEANKHKLRGCERRLSVLWSHITRLTAAYGSSSRGSKALASSGTYRHVGHMHLHRHTHMHIILKIRWILDRQMQGSTFLWLERNAIFPANTADMLPKLVGTEEEARPRSWNSESIGSP